MDDLITIDLILKHFKEWVEEGKPVSPSYWLDSAVKLNILSQDLDEQIAEIEGTMSNEETVLIEADMPASKAKVLKRKVIDYPLYLKLIAKQKRIIEFVRLAKKRIEIKYE